MITVSREQAVELVFAAIANGRAIALSHQNFTDTDWTGADYDIRFYVVDGRVFRTSHNGRTTMIDVHEIVDREDIERLLAPLPEATPSRVILEFDSERDAGRYQRKLGFGTVYGASILVDHLTK
jgi:hypothetical protein